MVIALLSLCLQQQAPADLVRVADELRAKTRAEVTVANEDGWQMWLESRGPISDERLEPVHGIWKLTCDTASRWRVYE